MGDPVKLILLEAVLDVIAKDNLLDTVEASGKALMDGLHRLQEKYPHLLHKIRGKGTFIAFNLPNATLRDKLLQLLLNKHGK